MEKINHSFNMVILPSFFSKSSSPLIMSHKLSNTTLMLRVKTWCRCYLWLLKVQCDSSPCFFYNSINFNLQLKWWFQGCETWYLLVLNFFFHLRLSSHSLSKMLILPSFGLYIKKKKKNTVRIMYKNKLYSFGEIMINKFSLTIEWPLDNIWLNDD